MLKGLLNRFKKEKPASKIIPVIIPRAQHSISRNNISPNALKVLYRLHHAGFGAYLVGGCVRDLLLGRKPKDFDIATSAHPEEVRRLFKNCRLIGKRFRLAHILFGREIIEVATFRTHHEKAEEKHAKMSQHGMIVRDNVYGTIEDDAWRRDFRVNALYYNIADFSVIDYTGGLQDIENKLLHIIGEPEQRFHEDPVRLLRTVRFLAKLNFTITAETEQLLRELSYLVGHVSAGRLYQEVLKFFHEGATEQTVILLQKYKLLPQLFPHTAQHIDKPEVEKLISQALKNTDQRIREGKAISPAFLFAVFLWYPLAKQTNSHTETGLPLSIAYEKALQSILKDQVQRLAIPRLMQISIREICFLQYRLNQRRGVQPYRLLDHPRFRAGYDLLLLRATVGEPIEELAAWWTEFQAADPAHREKMMKGLGKPPRRRHKKFKKRAPSDQAK